MREMQENYYLVLFMFASQLSPISLLGYWYFNLEARVFFFFISKKIILKKPQENIRQHREYREGNKKRKRKGENKNTSETNKN